MILLAKMKPDKKHFLLVIGKYLTLGLPFMFL